ncbi:MAG: right-handed parallel beta-helix repeat-containing protein [Clostridia bacterium]|nr:right-handed parallel beta-helix repeat-containing protein [Clostridia bacterium]MBR2328010.1 right-handed parallel beta-helix repeat-containing protein [Clostridia bacterium]
MTLFKRTLSVLTAAAVVAGVSAVIATSDLKSDKQPSDNGGQTTVGYADFSSIATVSEILEVAMNVAPSGEVINMSAHLTPTATAAEQTSYAVGNAAALNALLSSLDASKEYVLYFKGGCYGLNGAVTFPENTTLMFDSNASSSLYCGYGTTPVFNCKNVITESDHCVFYLDINSIPENSGNFANLSYVRPEWFGGFPSDGIDDSGAFTLAARFGIPVLLSEGVYNVNSPVNVRNDLFLYGNTESKGSVIKVAAGVTAFNVICYTSQSVDSNGVISRVGNAYVSRIENVKFEGAAMSSGGAVAYYGVNNGVSRIDAYNCEFNDLGTAVFFDFSGGCSFEDLVFNRVDRAVDVGAYSMFIFVTDCHAADSSCLVFCDQLETNGVANGIQIDRCSTLRNRWASVYITKNQTTFITNCNFDAISNWGIKLIECYDSRIDNNVITFSGTHSETGLFEEGIYLDTSSGRESVTGNHVIGFTIGIALTKGNCTRSGAIVHNNLIKDCVNGMYIANLNDVKIIANAFKGCAMGMYGSNNAGVIIAQNTFNGNGSDEILKNVIGFVSGIVANNGYGIA